MLVDKWLRISCTSEAMVSCWELYEGGIVAIRPGAGGARLTRAINKLDDDNLNNATLG